jgi:two-component system chemotaxis response regulator CheY
MEVFKANLQCLIFTSKAHTAYIQEKNIGGKIMNNQYAKKILVVDDFAPKRKIMRSILEKIGFNQIEEAQDGINAYSKLQHLNAACGLVITDCKMPNLDGIGLLKKIRNDKKLWDLPIMMIIDEVEEDKVIDAIFDLKCPYVEGVNNYLIKPINSKALKGKIDEIFGHYESESNAAEAL